MASRTELINIPQGDYGYDLVFTCQDADGTNFVLTGYTIHFKVWTRDIPAVLLVDGVCVIAVQNWRCTYTIVDGDFDTEGEFVGELELTKATERASFRDIRVIVRESG